MPKMSAPEKLVEVDSIDVIAVVDNEVDPMSPSNNPGVVGPGRMSAISLTPLEPGTTRGGALRELRMDNICCGAHGLSLLVTTTNTANNSKHSLLFDTGPEEETFARNAARLRLPLAEIEHVHLSHWHRDHSGGLLRAVRDITAAAGGKVTVDLHPKRPAFRGMRIPTGEVISLEADPAFEEVVSAGGDLHKEDQPHAVLEGHFLVSGEIPRETEYELGLRGGVRYVVEKDGWETDELILDERFVVCNLKGKGLVVFTGCSHAGVINVCRHAQRLAPGVPLYAVIGGFHLADGTPEKLAASLADMKMLAPKVLMPGHCTGWRFKFMAEQEMPGVLVPCFSGSRYTLQ